MCMKVCLCMGVCVSLGDGGSVRNQGKRAAAGRLDRPCRQRRPFSLGNNRNEYGRNRTTKITG